MCRGWPTEGGTFANFSPANLYLMCSEVFYSSLHPAPTYPLASMRFALHAFIFDLAHNTRVVTSTSIASHGMYVCRRYPTAAIICVLDDTSFADL
jgi:hypothetical protein